MKIGVLGATGQVGKEVAKNLEEKKAPHKLLVRNPEKAKALPQTELVSFDMTKKESYQKALSELTHLFLIANPSQESHLPSFLSSCQEVQLKQIVMISGMGVENSPNKFTARFEKLVENTKIPYVTLRCNWFMQNFETAFWDMVAKQKKLSFPDDHKTISYVDARDIADVATHFLLSQDSPSENLAYTITGPQSIGHEEIARIFSQYLPFEVLYECLTEEQAAETLGWEDDWLSLYRDVREGYYTPVSGSVGELLNRPGRPFEDFISEKASVWITKEISQ